MRDPVDWLKGLPSRIGRRGSTLLFLSLVDFLFAFSLMFPAKSQAPITNYLASILPLRVWAVMWFLAGLICFIQAFSHKDRIAFAVASLVMVLWGLVSLCAQIFAGIPRGAVSAVLWLGMAAFVFIISTWPEPPMKVSLLRKGPSG